MRGRYILWVRHCESCSNIAFDKKIDIMSKLRQPLCTQKGINQAYIFGQKLKEYTYNIVDAYDLEGINYYSSYLPRAIETSKLISGGYNSRHTRRQINRLPFISEYTQFYNRKKGTQSMTPIYKSNCYVNALNSIIPIGLSINQNHLFGRLIYQTLCAKSNRKYRSIDNCIIKGGADDYEIFKQYILPKLPANRLNIIVSHGRFIKKQVLSSFDEKFNKLRNLEAHLIHYSNSKEKYIKNRYITKCNDAARNIKKKDILLPVLDDEYKNYFNCKYKFHDKNPIFRFKRKSSIEKYC